MPVLRVVRAINKRIKIRRRIQNLKKINFRNRFKNFKKLKFRRLRNLRKKKLQSEFEG